MFLVRSKSQRRGGGYPAVQFGCNLGYESTSDECGQMKRIADLGTTEISYNNYCYCLWSLVPVVPNCYIMFEKYIVGCCQTRVQMESRFPFFSLQSSNV